MIPDVGIYLVQDGAFVLQAAFAPKSVSWECKYDATGTCQIVFDKDLEIVNTLTVNTFVSFAVPNGLWLNPIMYIHSVKITEKEVYAYGYEAKELLKKKAMIQRTENGTVDVADAIQDAVETYGAYTWLDTTATSTPNMGTANLDGLDCNTVYEFVQKCCKLKDCGWSVEISNTRPYKGVVAVYTETETTVRLATALGNISETAYTESNKSYATRVYALGSDGIVEQADAEIVYDDEVYEHILDLREEYPKPDDMTEADYRAAILSRARMSLAQRKLSTKIEVKGVELSDLGEMLLFGIKVQVIIPDVYYGDSVIKTFTGVSYTAENGTLKTSITLD